MNDAEFQTILDQLSKYLSADKKFISNPFRETELMDAIAKANELFPDAKVELHSDPLEMGAMILRIEDFSLDVTGEREINLFADIIRHANNFEIYPVDAENVRFAAVFQNVLVRI